MDSDMMHPEETELTTPLPGKGGERGTRRQTWLHVGFLVVLCAVLFFYRSGSLPLADPEEARCALIVRHMLRTGDWMVPHVDDEVYFDKPAPYFWLAALGEKLTGSAELGGRGVAAFSGILAVLLTYAFGRRVFGPTAGLLAGVVLATSGEFLFIARWFRMDMPFAAATWGALWCFWRSEAPSNPPAASRRAGWYGFYALCAVGTLFKGPVSLVLPVMIVALYLLLSVRPRRVFELLHPGGILLYLLIAAPWYVVISLREPAYAYEFFIRQHIVRYAIRNVGHQGLPGVLYVPILLGGLVPWTLFLAGAGIRYFPRRWRLRAASPGVLLLWLSSLVPFIFFAFSERKLAHYILPVFPPLAVLIGGVVAAWIAFQEVGWRSKLGTLSLLSAALLLVPAALVAEIWLGNLDTWFALPAAAVAVALTGMTVSLRRGRRGACVAWASAAVVTMLLYFIGHTSPAIYERMSTRSLARLVDPAARATAKLCCWDTRKLSFVYYTHAAEVERFRHSTPGDLEKLVKLLQSGQTVYCLVCDQERLDELKRACPGGFSILGQSGDRSIITNRPASGTRD